MLKLLDLFCGAGGASVGYHRAGFEVTGVDIRPMPRYPFSFVQGDALEYVSIHGHEHDVIHASPPCQAYSTLRINADAYPRLISDVRNLLSEVGKPYVIENVEGARKEMHNYTLLCGTMFGLMVRRHRLFECSNPILMSPMSCNHHTKTNPKGKFISENMFAAVYGNFKNLPFARKAMGIDWMTRDELAEAIPPAYTEYIGVQMLQVLT